MGGAAVAAVKAPAVHKLAAIPAGESVAWGATYRITSFDRISLQAFLLLPAKCSVQPGTSLIILLLMLEMSCLPHCMCMLVQQGM